MYHRHDRAHTWHMFAHDIHAYNFEKGGVGRDRNKGEGQFSVVYECEVIIHYVCEGPGMCMYMHYVWGYDGEGKRSVCIVCACMLCVCVCARCADSNEAVRGAILRAIVYMLHSTMLCCATLLF